MGPESLQQGSELVFGSLKIDLIKPTLVFWSIPQLDGGTAG
jgi:hypothetical protein